MATTAIFAEILIIGFQAIVWLALLSMTILGTPRIDLNLLKGWETLIGLLVLAVAYTLGIVVDRVADSVFDRFDQRLRKDFVPASPPSVHEMRLQVLAESEGMAGFLNYARSRVRIARSTAFNLVLIIVTAVLWIVTGPVGGSSKTTLLIFVVLVGVGVLSLTVFAWVRITKTYYLRVVQAYRIVRDKDGRMEVTRR